MDMYTCKGKRQGKLFKVLLLKARQIVLLKGNHLVEELITVLLR